MNILALKIGALHRSPERENGDFLETVFKGLDYISVVHG
jgi:hypothetical protein